MPLFSKGREDQLLILINTVNSNIQFTLENERNQALSYLDLEIIRQQDGTHVTLDTSLILVIQKFYNKIKMFGSAED